MGMRVHTHICTTHRIINDVHLVNISVSNTIQNLVFLLPCNFPPSLITELSYL